MFVTCEIIIHYVSSIAVVTGYQQPSESVSGSASQFYISILDSNQKEDIKLEDKGQSPFILSGSVS